MLSFRFVPLGKIGHHAEPSPTILDYVTSDLHLLRASAEGLLGSTSKFSLRYFSLINSFQTLVNSIDHSLSPQSDNEDTKEKDTGVEVCLGFRANARKDLNWTVNGGIERAERDCEAIDEACR